MHTKESSRKFTCRKAYSAPVIVMYHGPYLRSRSLQTRVDRELATQSQMSIGPFVTLIHTRSSKLGLCDRLADKQSLKIARLELPKAPGANPYNSNLKLFHVTINNDNLSALRADIETRIVKLARLRTGRRARIHHRSDDIGPGRRRAARYEHT